MKKILKGISKAVASHQSLLAVLIDPDKFEADQSKEFLRKIPFLTTHIFIGGSTDSLGKTEACVRAIKSETDLPVVLFPGDHSQVTGAADGILFLSLLSGRNPEYLIGQQVKSARFLRSANLEIIPTAYILVDGGTESSVQKVTRTSPLAQHDPEIIVETALAGEYSGKRLIYLEAGSGAKNPVSPEVIAAVKAAVSVPVVVGGGIRSKSQLKEAYSSGADMVVVGTAFEKGDFFV